MLGIIVDIIGIAGFAISLANVIYYLICNRKRLIFHFGEYGVKDYIQNKNLLLIYFRADNLSHQPISITRMQLCINNSNYDSETRPHKAEEQRWTRGGQVYHEIIVDTKVLPINLSPLASESGYLAFVIPQDILSDSEISLNFRICTSRGRAIQKTFELHEDVKCS